MPASKSRGTTKKRTHNLGGCATCRRRHVKCDHARPTCATCRKAGLDCGGYVSQIRWAPMSFGPSRPPEAYESSRQSSQVNQGTQSERCSLGAGKLMRIQKVTKAVRLSPFWIRTGVLPSLGQYHQITAQPLRNKMAPVTWWPRLCHLMRLHSTWLVTGSLRMR
jgi:hypothetical protein